MKLKSALVLAVLLATFAFACKPAAVVPPGLPQGDAAAIEPAPDALPTDPRAVDLKKSAETKILPAMKPPVVEFVRAQEWFVDLTQAEYVMLETLRDTDKASQRHGTEAALMNALHLTAEQAWVNDGFDDNEAKALSALFHAYQSSLADRHVPDIGPLMASSIRGNYFHVLNLPESGEVTIVLAADNDRLAPKALQLAVENLPKVESIVGAFPYSFVHIWVTDLGGDGLLGLNRNEFVLIGEDAVDTNTMAHELAHATLYGNFPIWFEEGFAYFVGSYADNALQAQERESLRTIALTGRPRKLDLTAKFDHSDRGYFSTISQGFLFFKGLIDIEGLEGTGRIVRSLRSKTYNNDNELLRAIVSNSTPEKQPVVQKYLCDSVIGLRSGCP